ncbi:MAG: dihydroorotase [Promethearchaeota archaeon]
MLNGKIKEIHFKKNQNIFSELKNKNEDNEIIDCKNKIILPGIIDIHAHLRDMDQSEKETFHTGTKAAAMSGITTVFNMPNTKPPAITAEIIQKWMKKAENNIYTDVAFIAGVPENFNEEEVKKIIKLGVFGFKIYPLKPITTIDWLKISNIQKLLKISSEYRITIFIHPDWPLIFERKEEILEQNVLKLHNQLYPCDMEAKYVNFIIENYYKFISDNNIDQKKYPIVHFCHISCIESYNLIKNALQKYPQLKITFEVTPHHLLLSNDIIVDNPNFAKVLPPLRNKKHSEYLMNELKAGNIPFIGTDHAPHTLAEKARDYFEAPSGFPGFETYTRLLLSEVSNYRLSLEKFMKVAAENAAIKFKFSNKGFIKKNYDADLIIVDKVPEFKISAKNFYTKAKFSPFEGFKSNIKIDKVFLRGIEINSENAKPTGKILKRKY